MPELKCVTQRWDSVSNSIPDDVALAIASLLEASDVCSLGSCSRFWREICASDCLWVDLCKRRWPALDPSEFLRVSQTQGWKEFFISQHKKMACCASSVVNFVEQSSQNGSLEVGRYLQAIGDLCSAKLGFKDVQLFLLAKKHGVLLNLIGLHYSISFLGIRPSDVMEALRSCQVSDRQVCVAWFKFGRWFYGFRMPDGHWSRKVSLGKLVMDDEDEVLTVLGRGAVHEVLRVQITPVTASAGESCQIPGPNS